MGPLDQRRVDGFDDAATAPPAFALDALRARAALEAIDPGSEEPPESVGVGDGNDDDPDDDDDDYAGGGGGGGGGPPSDSSSDDDSDIDAAESSAGDGSDDSDSGSVASRVQQRRRGALQRRPPRVVNGRTVLLNVGERVECDKCHARMWRAELRGRSKCCGNGKYVLDAACNPPIAPDWLDIMRSDDYSKNSRYLNGAACFGSPGTMPTREDGGLGLHDLAAGRVGGIALHGRAYFNLWPLTAIGGFNTYMQPSEYVIDQAAHTGGPLYAVLVGKVINYFNEHHPLARSFVACRDWAATAGAMVLPATIAMENTTRPSAKAEVAWLSPMLTSPYTADRQTSVLLFDVDRASPTAIPPTSPFLETLQFPLLFETGTGGWRAGVHGSTVSTTGGAMTLMQYTCSMLYQNERLAHAGRAAQEWALFMDSRNLERKCEFLRHCPQVQTRRGTVRAGDPGVRAGRMPGGGIPGSKAYNAALVEDCLAVIARLGKPTYFITFTANPAWAEVLAALEPGQTAADRPDIVLRVFHLKLRDLMEDLRKGTTFGAKASYTFEVIE